MIVLLSIFVYLCVMRQLICTRVVGVVAKSNVTVLAKNIQIHGICSMLPYSDHIKTGCHEATCLLIV